MTVIARAYLLSHIGRDNSIKMKKLLVPIDLNKGSLAAARYAASLANVLGAELQLLHIYKESIPATMGPDPWSISKSPIHEKKQEKLDLEGQQLSQKYQVKVSSTLLTGTKSDAITKVADESDSDLVVMYLKEDNKLIPGSTVFKVIRKSNKAVLLIKEDCIYKPIRNIVLAVDFNQPVDPAALAPLIEIVKKYDAALRVIHVENKGADYIPYEMGNKLKLGTLLGKLSYIYDKLEDDDIDIGIVNYIESHPADLLVMIEHHHNLMTRLFGTIHTTNMSYISKIPILIL